MYIISVKKKNKNEWLYLTAVDVVRSGMRPGRVIDLSVRLNESIIFNTVEEAEEYCDEMKDYLKKWVKMHYADEKTLSIRKLAVRFEKNIKL